MSGIIEEYNKLGHIKIRKLYLPLTRWQLSGKSEKWVANITKLQLFTIIAIIGAYLGAPKWVNLVFLGSGEFRDKTEPLKI